MHSIVYYLVKQRRCSVAGFEEKHGENDKIPEALENYLKLVAKTGDIL